MTVVDVDAHFHEPVDWLTGADPKLAAELPPPPDFAPAQVIAPAIEGSSLPVPKEELPGDPLGVVGVELRGHLMKAEAMQPEHYQAHSGNPHYDPEARIRVCDAEGIDVQFLNATMALVQGLVQVHDSGHPEFLDRLISAYNRWAAEQVEGYTDRLIPVAQIFPDDVGATVAEMTRMREKGSRVFRLPQNNQKSYSHPDYEPMWSAAEDLGMIAYVHLPFRGSVNRSFANNGRGLETFVHLGGLSSDPMTRDFLTAMVFDGLFERHPRLRVILAEVGYAWLPQFLFDIDAKTTKIAMDGLPQESFYRLPLKPSEYIQRHVRVTATPGFIESGFEWLSVADTLERLPDPDMLVFTSDYPHVEGRESPFSFFDKLLPDDEKLRESFYGRSLAEFCGL
jgi:predicted TIM-barrel fold metal-dependent hydrolase